MNFEEDEDALVVELYAQQFNWKKRTQVPTMYWGMLMFVFYKITMVSILLGSTLQIQMV